MPDTAAARRWRDRRRREADALVLQALRDGRPHHVYADLQSTTHLSFGRLYRALVRLLDRGLIEDGWEDKPTYPRRRWYRLADPASAATPTEETR